MKQYDAEIDAHNATKERLTAAKQRAEALLARIADLERWNTRQKMIYDASEKRVEALRDALAFYALERTPSMVHADRGRRARSALSGVAEEKSRSVTAEERCPSRWHSYECGLQRDHAGQHMTPGGWTRWPDASEEKPR